MTTEASDEAQPIDEPDDDRHTSHQDASLIAGETDVPVGSVTGEFPAERVQAAREREATSTGKHAFLVMAGILLSRVVGLVRQRVMAHYFGTTDVGDAFNVALRIPNFLQNVFGEGALSASFIPVYAGLLAHDEEREADHVASAVFSILALVTSVLVLLGVLFTPHIISVIALGYTGGKRDLTITLARIFFPSPGLLVLSAWCLGVLNSHRRFFLSYTAPVVWNITLIAALAWAGRPVRSVPLSDLGVWGRVAAFAAWGSVLGSALQFGVQLPTVLVLLRRVRLALGAANANVSTVIRNFLPVFFSRGVVQISAFVDA